MTISFLLFSFLLTLRLISSIHKPGFNYSYSLTNVPIEKATFQIEGAINIILDSKIGNDKAVFLSCNKYSLHDLGSNDFNQMIRLKILDLNSFQFTANSILLLSDHIKKSDVNYHWYYSSRIIHIDLNYLLFFLSYSIFI